MSETIFNVGLMIGEDIRTRARIGEIKSMMKCDERYVLDFSRVEFISRSFADELVSLIDDSSNKISIINTNNEVGSMMSIVREGRMHYASKLHSDNVRALHNLKEIEHFFSCL